MIDTIKREIDNMNRDVAFYQALTDEEDIRFQINTERNIGLQECIKKVYEVIYIMIVKMKYSYSLNKKITILDTKIIINL